MHNTRPLSNDDDDDEIVSRETIKQLSLSTNKQLTLHNDEGWLLQVSRWRHRCVRTPFYSNASCSLHVQMIPITNSETSEEYSTRTIPLTVKLPINLSGKTSPSPLDSTECPGTFDGERIHITSLPNIPSPCCARILWRHARTTAYNIQSH